MSTARTVTIIGGGLAGLTLGIALRKRDTPVTLWEAGHYPRHRVCGEFISGRGQQSLERVGLLESIREAGAIEASTVGFYTAKTGTDILKLPERALCLPRYEMDALFARQFRDAGGELRENEKWSGEFNDEGVVVATGRWLQSATKEPRWFGLKVHASDVSLKADLEMHVSSDGYVGLCREPGGIVNICGLFRNGHAKPDWEQRFRGLPGSLLSDRMRSAVFAKETFCAVAGINLQPQRARSEKELRIGDALTMIPPLTGNGMSIAFESAELATEPLLAWSSGRSSWQQTHEQIAGRCDKLLSRRLRWAAWLQRAALNPLVQDGLARLVTRNLWLWRFLFERTR